MAPGAVVHERAAPEMRTQCCLHGPLNKIHRPELQNHWNV